MPLWPQNLLSRVYEKTSRVCTCLGEFCFWFACHPKKHAESSTSCPSYLGTDKMKNVQSIASKVTPLKINMEPQNQPLEKEIPIGNHHFQVPF